MSEPVQARRPWKERIAELLRALDRTEGFVLFPVEVNGLSDARALCASLTSHDRPSVLLEPHGADWLRLSGTLRELAVELERQRRADLVLVWGSSPLDLDQIRGLSALNRSRDLLIQDLHRPLLWCGDARFLEESWRAMPDLWSVRGLPIRLGDGDHRPVEWARSAEARPPSRARSERLGELFTTLFTREELFQFLRGLPSGHALLDSLPDGSSGIGPLAHEAASWLEKQGLIGPDLHAALARAFPSRIAEISAQLGPTGLLRAEPALRDPVRVLHLANLRLREGERWEDNLAYKALLSDLSGLQASGQGIDLVAITGDVAWSGLPREYDAATRFLAGPLRDVLGSDVSIACVPGNHDVDVSRGTRAAKTLIESVLKDRSGEALDELMRDDAAVALLHRRLEAWRHFAERITGQTHPERPGWKCVLHVRDSTVHLACFDMAWALLPGYGAGGRLLGREQVYRVLRGAENADLVLGLLHHPLESLADWDEQVCAPIVRQSCDALLIGQRGLIEEAGRAAHGPETFEIWMTDEGRGDGLRCYQVLSFDTTNGAGQAVSRVWSGERWMADRGLGGVSRGELRFQSRPRRGMAVTERPPLEEPLRAWRQAVRARCEALPALFQVSGAPSGLSASYVRQRVLLQDRLAAPEQRSTSTDSVELERLLDSDERRWMLLGEAGAGKTIALRHLALTLLDRGNREPVLLDAGDLVTGEDLGASIQRAWGPEAALGLMPTIQAGRAVILVDGLDATDEPIRVARAVELFASQAPRCVLIAAARHSRPQPIGFGSAQLQPLDASEQLELLFHWLGDARSADDAWTILSSWHALGAFLHNPLLLSLVGLSLREGVELPEQRGELLNRATVLLLTRAHDAGLRRRRLAEPRSAREALAWAALRTLHLPGDIPALALGDALVESPRFTRLMGAVWGGPEAFLAEVAGTAGLLIPSGPDAYTFLSEGFREHLASVALAAELEVSGIPEAPEEALWWAAGCTVSPNGGRSASRHSVPVEAPQGELRRALWEKRRYDSWSRVLAGAANLVGLESRERLARYVSATLHFDRAQAFLAEVEDLAPRTVNAMLGLREGWDRAEERRRMLEQIPAMSHGHRRGARLLARVVAATSNGDDLYWCRETLRRLSKGELSFSASDAWSEDIGAEVELLTSRGFQRRFDALASLRADVERLCVSIPAGTWLVGSRDPTDPEIERPPYEATLPSPLRMMSVPVTWGLYERLDPEHRAARHDFDGRLPVGRQDEVPVYRLTWYAASMFAAAVGGRLPTEVEWELACRAGTASRYWSGNADSLDSIAWHGANSGGHPHPVGTRAANPWGLHDMTGNVWEYCADPWDPDAYKARAGSVVIDPVSGALRRTDGRLLPISSAPPHRVCIRGGSWDSEASWLRSACRNVGNAASQLTVTGFRVVLPR